MGHDPENPESAGTTSGPLGLGDNDSTLRHRIADLSDRLRRPRLDEIGPYRLLEELGEGGIGVVYKAQQRQPVQRTVALQLIKVGAHTREAVARFEAERQALATLDHPSIA